MEHSHSRGKKWNRTCSRSTGVGALPLTWEKACCSFCFFAHLRNTPTCVGKSKGQLADLRSPWEHSHLRGKKSNCPDMPDKLVGTLPLAWEKDSVFMRHSEVFAAICMKNFYKIFHTIIISNMVFSSFFCARKRNTL